MKKNQTQKNLIPRTMDKHDKIITIALISLSAIFSFFALPEATTHIKAENKTASVVAPLYFQNVELEAKAAYVYDLTTEQELFSKNANQSLPLASLTKIMTAVTAAEIAPSPLTIVTIDEASLHESGNNDLYIDERWDLSKILQFMLVASSNDAASAVATSIGPAVQGTFGSARESFINAMNSKARELELYTLQFSNPTGLDESSIKAGAYGSAKDVAHLLAYAAKREGNILEPTRYDQFEVSSIDGIRHKITNTDTIVHKIPGLIAGKTGYTELAGGNLTIIFDAGIQHPIAIVVLGSTYEGRFTDMKKLVDESIKIIAEQ